MSHHRPHEMPARKAAESIFFETMAYIFKSVLVGVETSAQYKQ